MRHMIALLLLLLWPALAHAEVTITAPDGPVEVGEYVQLMIGGLSDERMRQSRVIAFPRERVTVMPVKTWGGDPLILFTAKLPGKYLIGVASPGEDDAAVDYAEVVIKVGDPNPEPDPKPDPDPDPKPDDPLYGVVIVEESSERTPQLASVLTSTTVADFIKTSKLAWHVIDQDATAKTSSKKSATTSVRWVMRRSTTCKTCMVPQAIASTSSATSKLAPYIELAKKRGLPTLFIIGEKGTVYYQGTVPTTPQELIDLVTVYVRRSAGETRKAEAN